MKLKKSKTFFFLSDHWRERCGRIRLGRMRKSIWIRALQHGLRSPGETLDQFKFQIFIEFNYFTQTCGCLALFKTFYGNVSSHSYNCNDYEIENN